MHPVEVSGMPIDLEKQRARQRRYARKPEVQAKAVAAHRERMKDPAKREAHRAATRRWHHKNRERLNEANRGRHLKRTYGVSPELFASMALAQGGACAVCRRVPKYRLHVDHDHATGEVRSLLCAYCNHLVGTLEKHPGLVERCASYLESHDAGKSSNKAS